MAAESASEQELQFKKRARRRLVGAITLVLLMLITLPFVLQDRQPASVETEVSINMPEPVKSPDPVAGTEEFNSKITPLEEVNTPSETTEVDAPEPNKEAALQPTQKLPEKTSSPSKQSDSTAESKAEKKSTKGKVMVQIGVFSDKNNVLKMSQKLKDNGLNAVTENLPKGVRLRTGPFADKAEAQAALEQVKKLGLPGILVTL